MHFTVKSIAMHFYCKIHFQRLDDENDNDDGKFFDT